MKKEPFIVAHRGLSATYPESTRIAFEKALELPIDGIEFDLHPTKDGKIVVGHDDTLDRCSNGTGLVREKTLAELRELDFGAWKSPEFAGEKILEFSELLDIVEAKRPELFLCVEIKESNPACAVAILEELKRCGRLHNCSIISFHFDMLCLANQFESGLELHGFNFDYLNWGGKKIEYTDALVEQGLKIFRRVGEDHRVLTAEMVKFYHDRGIKVDVWAPDTPEAFTASMDKGVDFITTNAADIITKAAGR